jgi:tetratricopeptide (TPR) repeat protein
VLAAPAHAQEPATPANQAITPPSEAAVQEAGQRYDRGLKMYAEGDYSLAVIEFERAYELVPDYRVLYNIGQVRIQLANYAKARRALEQYLKEGGDRIADDRKKAVENDLDMLATRTGTLAIAVNVPGAEIFVDDVVVGQSPLSEPLLLDAGEHRLSARKPGYHPRAAQVTLAGRDALDVKLTLEKIPAESQRIIVQQKTDDSDRATWMWGSWTAAGVFAIVSGVTGGLGIKAANDLDEKRREQGASRSELDSSSRRARTLLLTADVFGGLAIATGGLALYFTLSGSDEAEPGKETRKAPGKTAKNQLGVSVTPGFVGVTGTY